MPVVFCVQFGRFTGVVRRVLMVALRRVRVMRGRGVIAFLVVLRGLAMVMRRLLMVFRRVTMVLCCLSGHGSPLFACQDCLLRRLRLGPLYYGNVMQT